jgi:hypothetical protein
MRRAENTEMGNLLRKIQYFSTSEYYGLLNEILWVVIVDNYVLT